MHDQDWLADRFEAHRGHLRGVAYRMLGSATEADDAVQETWLRLSRSDTSEVDNLRAWLTTVVARVCLNMLRARRTRREAPLDAETPLPDPIVRAAEAVDPEEAALLGDAVGVALQVVLASLAPAERVAFVLHDVFAVPFDEIAPIVGRTPEATRQLASRGRRRVRAADRPAGDLAAQWTVVDAFLAAVRSGDMEALLAILDPDIVVRAEVAGARAGGLTVVRGAPAAAAQAMSFRRFADSSMRVVVDGRPGGLAWTPDDRPFALLAMTVREGRIVAIDVLADPDRLARIDLPARDR